MTVEVYSSTITDVVTVVPHVQKMVVQTTGEMFEYFNELYYRELSL